MHVFLFEQKKSMKTHEFVQQRSTMKNVGQGTKTSNEATGLPRQLHMQWKLSTLLKLEQTLLYVGNYPDSSDH